MFELVGFVAGDEVAEGFDFAVFFVKADGSARPKVFKLRRVTLPARATVTLSGTISFAVHSTRKPRPGRHAIEARIKPTADTIKVTLPRPDTVRKPPAR